MTDETPSDRLKSTLDDNLAMAWADTLKTERGRMVVWSILEMCRPFQLSYGDDSDFFEGQRHIGLQLLNSRVMANGPETFGLMMKENADRVAAIEAALDEESNDVGH